MSRAAEHGSALAAAQSEAEQARAKSLRLEGLRAAEVRRSSALSVRLNSANAELSLLRSDAGDLRRELEKLRTEREASEAASLTS